MSDLSKRTAANLTSENRIKAVNTLTKNIWRVSDAWETVSFLESNYPDLAVGKAWDTIRRVHDEMGAMIKEWDREDG